MASSLSNVINYCKTINGSLGFNDTKTQFINSMVQDYNEAHENAIYRFDVLINTIDAKDIYVNSSETTIKGVIDTSKKQTADTEIEQTIQVYPNQIKRGDYIKFKMNDTDELRTYLVKSKVDKKNSYDEAVFEECNYTLKWMIGGKYYEMPAIVTNNTKYTLGIKSQSSSGLTEADGMFGAIVSWNEIAKKIPIGERFIVNGQAWEATQLDHSSAPNILSILLGESSKSTEYDDMENEIADAYLYSYEITLNSTSETLVETSTYQIMPTITNNGVLVSNATIIYSSSDETIATVDENGLVTAVSVGNAIITASIGSVSATLDLVVTEKTVEPVISYGYTWSNGTNLKTYMSSTISLTKTINSVSSPLIATYSLDSVGTTLLNAGNITIIKKSDYSYQIKNVNVSTIKSFVITFTDSSGSAVIATQTINFSGM